MAITTTSILFTITVLNLHRINNRPVPRWLKKMVLGIIANIILCKIPSMKPINSADTNDCDEKDKWKREWKLVAEVLDRWFFLVDFRFLYYDFLYSICKTYLTDRN